MSIELIPSAKRLIRSLRDVGYEFAEAVADLVDNSIEAEATIVSIKMHFEGENSYITISDNGIGMGSVEVQEALRFGSDRAYNDYGDLGRYGLGLKTASLSQCERLTVTSRRSVERAVIHSFCWDLSHVERTNRWEILPISTHSLRQGVTAHLYETTGTVITWERIGRLLGYKYPSGEFARKEATLMMERLKTHLGMIFHKYLSGEVDQKRLSIYIDSERVVPWDPYSLAEPNTIKFDEILIPIGFGDHLYNVKLQPYILPSQAAYSTKQAHMKASGPRKWNRQQGLYLYRTNRIIQAGGWCGLRTSDEHTKLVRVAVLVPTQLDELFQVNIAKKHANLPKELRAQILDVLAPVIHRSQEIYRDVSTIQLERADAEPDTKVAESEVLEGLGGLRCGPEFGGDLKLVVPAGVGIANIFLDRIREIFSLEEESTSLERVLPIFNKLYSCASDEERNVLFDLVKRYHTSLVTRSLPLSSVN